MPSAAGVTAGARLATVATMFAFALAASLLSAPLFSAPPAAFSQEGAFDLRQSLAGLDLDLSDDPAAVARLVEAGVLTVLGKPFRGTDTDMAQLDWAPDGTKLLSVGTSGELDLWDAATGERITRVVLFDEDEFTMVTTARFLRDGSVAAFRDDGVMLVLDGGTLEQRRTVAGVPVCSEVVLSADRKVAATVPGAGVEDGTHVLEMPSGKRRAFFTDEAGFCTSVSLNADGSLLAFLSHGGTNGELLGVRRTETGEVVSVEQPSALRLESDVLPPRLRRVVLDRAGGAVVVSSHGHVEILGLGAPQQKTRRLGPASTSIASVALAPDGQALYLGTDSGALLGVIDAAPTGARSGAPGDQQVGRRRRVFRDERSLRWAHLHGVVLLEVSPDGERLATVGRDGALRFWSAASFAPVHHQEGPLLPASAGDFRVDGSGLVTGYDDGSVWRLDASGRPAVPLQEARALHQIDGIEVEESGAIIASFMGQLGRELVGARPEGATTAGDGRARLGQREVATVFAPLTDLTAYGDALWRGAVRVGLTHDGAVGGLMGAGVGLELFDLGGQKRIARVDLGLRPATFLAFERSDRRLATGLPDGRVLVWDLGALAKLR